MCVFERRSCGCAVEAAGFGWHIHSIHSYEKLTGEGMHFMGGTLIRLTEQLLPQRFGGSPTDYQFVERSLYGMPRVDLIVRPSVGEVDEARLIQFVIDQLGAPNRGDNMMANRWKQGETLRGQRRQPFSTPAAKIPALHVLETGDQRDSARATSNSHPEIRG